MRVYFVSQYIVLSKRDPRTHLITAHITLTRADPLVKRAAQIPRPSAALTHALSLLPPRFLVRERAIISPRAYNKEEDTTLFKFSIERSRPACPALAAVYLYSISLQIFATLTNALLREARAILRILLRPIGHHALALLARSLACTRASLSCPFVLFARATLVAHVPRQLRAHTVYIYIYVSSFSRATNVTRAT